MINLRYLAESVHAAEEKFRLLAFLWIAIGFILSSLGCCSHAWSMAAAYVFLISVRMPVKRLTFNPYKLLHAMTVRQEPANEH